ncbi:MAG: MBL fold metallo-hydrolase [Candidatus Ranarchaeia archaeon]|jgi:ribonuclease Z
MKIHFLGTGGGKSIVSRGSPALYIESKDTNILLDCGPHSVHQALKSQLPLDQVTHIIFTHLHFDHCLGLPAWLLNTWLLEPDALPTLHIPPESRGTLTAILTSLPIDFRSKLDLDIQEDPLDTDVELSSSFSFHSTRALHGNPESHELARMIRLNTSKGQLVYTGDTAPTPHIIELAREVDLLIHEATHPDSERKLAHQLGHCTPQDAATHAKEAKVKHLLLTHISSTMAEDEFIVNARKIFPKTQVARDFQQYSI